MVNVTLCFSANQALLAAKAGATFVSPFLGRLDDINLDGMDLIRDIRQIFDNYDFDTEILAASVRQAFSPSQVSGTLTAMFGASCASLRPSASMPS